MAKAPKRPALPPGDQHQAVRLLQFRGHLGHEFVGGDADEQLSPVRARISAFTRRAQASPSPKSRPLALTSRKASSRLRGSTSGVSISKT